MSLEYELARKNRFVVEFPAEFQIDNYLVQKVNRPKLVGGVWQDITMNFIETVPDPISEKLFRLLRHCNLGRSNPLFYFWIFSIDPVGNTTQKWTISVNEIVAVDFGEYDYGNDDIQTVTMVIKPKECFLNLSSVEEWEKLYKRVVLFEKYKEKKS